MAVLRNLTMSPLHKRRQRRGRPGLPGEAGPEGSEPSDALGPEDKKDGDLDTDELLKGEGWAGESQRRQLVGDAQAIGVGMLGRGLHRHRWPPALLVWPRWHRGRLLGSLIQDDKDSRALSSDLPPPLVFGAGGVEHMECEVKLEGPASPDVEPGREETEESKKRKRKPYRPGKAREWGCGQQEAAHQSPVPSPS